MNVSIVLSLDEVNTLLTGLLELPGKVCVPLMSKLQGAVNAEAKRLADAAPRAGDPDADAQASVEDSSGDEPAEVPGE